MQTQNRLLLPLAGLLLTGFFAIGAVSSVSAARPVVYADGGGYYVEYPNRSHAYRHGVRTPFNSYPTIPQIPTVPMPSMPRVPIPTMADLMPNPQDTPQPYIGPDGIGYYGDTGPVDEWNEYPQEYQPNYDTDEYTNAEAGHDQMNALSDELQYSTDKKMSKKNKKSKKSKKSKKKIQKADTPADEEK